MFREGGYDSLTDADLTEGVIHLWAAPVDDSFHPSVEDRSILSDSEKLKASSFAFESLGKAYIASHVLLRRVLSTYTRRHPSEITFTAGSNGKPALIQDSASPPIEFNLSHCDRMAIVAVSRRAVGVDIERLRPMDDYDAIARSVFAPPEYLTQTRLPSHLKQRTFFERWTRKESVVKALGGGLSLPLDSFEVTAGSDAPPRVVRFGGLMNPAWSLLHLEPADGIIGAVAAPYEIKATQAVMLACHV
jgi:4'-phosphopantetheinyl transferase